MTFQTAGNEKRAAVRQGLGIGAIEAGIGNQGG